jgi:biopolymer transport protein ExbD
MRLADLRRSAGRFQDDFSIVRGKLSGKTKMGQRIDQPRGCSPVAIAVVLFAGMVLMLVLIAGGAAALIWVRMRTNQQHVQVERERAMTELARARRMAEAARQRAKGALDTAQAAASGSWPDSGKEVTIEIDESGNLRVGGLSTALIDLNSTLLKAHEETAGLAWVVVRVDNSCVFEHVARVLAVCEEVGIDDVRVRAAEKPNKAMDKPWPPE